jgi:alpha-tubulin suppressor-like RCC1 family protein
MGCINLKYIQLLNPAWAAGILWTLVSPMGAVGGGTVVGWGDNRFGESTPGASNVVAIAVGYEQSLLLINGGTVADFGRFWTLIDDFPITVPPDLANVVAVAAGVTCSLALKADGSVVAWCPSGQLEVPIGLTNVAAISTTADANLALRTDGTVAAWGYLTNVPIDLSNAVAIAVGYVYWGEPPLGLALRPDGTVSAWDSTGAYVQVPPGWTNLVSISGGAAELLGLKADGTVVDWPGGAYGGPSALTNLTNVVAISASSGNDGHISLALKADGAVAGWGYNFYGGPFVPPGLSNVVAVAAGGELDLALIGGGPPFLATRLVNRMAVTADTAYFRIEATGAWPLSYQWRFNGTNLPGATHPLLGLTNLQPSQAGAYSVMVSNAYGVVTSDAALLTVLPVLITTPPLNQACYVGGTATFNVEAQGAGPLSYQWSEDGMEIEGATNAVLVFTNLQSEQAGAYSVTVGNAFGGASSAGVLLTVLPAVITVQPQDQVTFVGGAAILGVVAQASVPLSYRWMLNGIELNGATNATLALSNAQPAQTGAYSVEVSDAFGTVASSGARLSVVQVAAWGAPDQSEVPPELTNATVSVGGEIQALALKADGSVVAWGQLSHVPAGLTNVVAIAGGYYWNMALKADGSIVAWGDNTYGQTNVPAGLTNTVAIAAREYHGLALAADGSVMAWGYNWAASAPVPPGLGDVVAVAAGADHNLVLRADGRLVAWGDKTDGETDLPARVSNVVAIACGDYHSLALQADGTVTAWGRILSPVPAGLTNVVAIAGGGSHSLALQADGTVTAWGDTSQVPAGLTNVVAIACGDAFSLALVGDRPPVRRASLLSPRRNAEGFSVSVPTQSGRVYRLEYKSSLADANWIALPLVAGNGGVRQLTDSTATGAHRFYRVRRW